MVAATRKAMADLMNIVARDELVWKGDLGEGGY